MIAELGHFALVLAFCMACIQGIFPLLGSYYKNTPLLLLARPAAWAQLFFIVLSILILLHAFVTDDFTVTYVAQNSNKTLPLPYKISALWSAHEGSLLLWSFILSLWTIVFSCKSSALPQKFVIHALSILGLVSAGFLSFMLFTSNPFARTLLFPMENGADLNPLLQDIGLIIHPPLLYAGYVGFSIPFAIAIAALLSGELNAAWARWVRPWTTVAWIFLTCGITLGSWWAYYELGWGGWWFWDPVENASLLPWLSGTALMHSLAVSEKRNLFKRWTVFLAIVTFALSLLGTFIVRSGVLTSVHAFTADPERGIFILAFLLLLIGSSLTLFAIKAPLVTSKHAFNVLSVESLLLLNNVLLITACSTVLLGTLFPIIADVFGWGKLSVGAPYFNTLIVPLSWLTAFLIGVGVTANWKKTLASYLFRQLKYVFGLTLFLVALIGYLQTPMQPVVIITLSLVAWIVLTTTKAISGKLKHKNVLTGLARIPKAVWGMHLSHLGFAITMVGAVMSSFYGVEENVLLKPNTNVVLDSYSFRFDGIRQFEGPNFVSQYALINVFKNGQFEAAMRPEKRLFHIRNTMMSEAAIAPGFFRDLYITLGEPVGKENAWSFRIQIKPFVRWIWAGGFIMALGGFLAMSDFRYRKNQDDMRKLTVVGFE